MPKRELLLMDSGAFSADTPDNNIYRPAYLDQLIISMRGQTTAAASVTWSTLMAALSKFTTKLNGVPVADISLTDLFALNHLWIGSRPLGISSGATATNPCRIMGVVLPVGLPSGPEILTYKAAYTAQTNLGTVTLNILAEYADMPIKPSLFRITTYSYTPPSTGALNKALSMTAKGPLEALLIYATTIPTSAADTKTVDKLEVRVGGLVQISTNWEALKAAPQAGATSSETVVEGVVDNYVLLDLRGDPIPAGADVDIYINSGDTNAVRIITIERA